MAALSTLFQRRPGLSPVAAVVGVNLNRRPQAEL
jgi:hypothetical protein